jgi:hypothetical protein
MGSLGSGSQRIDEGMSALWLWHVEADVLDRDGLLLTGRQRTPAEYSLLRRK